MAFLIIVSVPYLVDNKDNDKDNSQIVKTETHNKTNVGTQEKDREGEKQNNVENFQNVEDSSDRIVEEEKNIDTATTETEKENVLTTDDSSANNDETKDTSTNEESIHNEEQVGNNVTHLTEEERNLAESLEKPDETVKPETVKPETVKPETIELPNTDKTLTMSPATADNLVPLVKALPIHQRVEEILKDMEVDNYHMVETGAGHFIKFSFIQEDSKTCENVLNKLKNIGVGQTTNTSVSVFPASLHESYKAVDSPEEEDEWADNEDSDSEEIIQESNFKKSIKSRMVVAQVVASVRSNAMFTFDYLLLLILASIIACLGLVENSSVVLVASMLISPLMGPILAGTFGTVIKNKELRNLGIKTELVGLSLCILVGFLFGLVSGGIGLHGAVWGSTDQWPTSEMKSRGMLRSMWVGVLIALPSGAGVAISVLGGNAGSLVGVAISASLLPPACNAGMLWAYGLLAAIKPPAIIQAISTSLPTTTTTAATTTIINNLTTIATTILGNSIISNTTIIPPSTTTTATPVFSVPESCLPLVNNAYRPVYSCNLSHDAAVLGLVSLVLTLLNITCIFLMGIIVLRIKEVAPHTAGTSTTSSIDNFWQKDIQVARTYYHTSKGESSVSLGKQFMEEWKSIKAKHKKTEDIEEDEESITKPLETINMCNYISGVENSSAMQHVLKRLSPASPTPVLSAGLQKEYSQARFVLDNQMAKNPSVYLREHVIKDKKVQNVYHTIHNTQPDVCRPGITELRNRFRRQNHNSMFIESTILDELNEQREPTLELKEFHHNDLYKRRKRKPKVKFQVMKVEEEPLVQV